MSHRYTPVAVSGLSSGVVMVAAGYVRARVVCCGYLRVLGMWARVYVACLPRMRAVAPVGRVVMLMSVWFVVCVLCVMGWSHAVSAWAWCDVMCKVHVGGV